MDGTTGEKVVVCVGDDTILRVFCSSANAGEGEEGNEWDDMLSCTASLPSAAEEGGVEDGEGNNVVGVVLHPTGKHVFVTTASGTIQFHSITPSPNNDDDDDSKPT